MLLSRVVAWLGRGTREPPRDALLVDSTKPEFHGRVFWFHRGMDPMGAIVGPATALFLIKSMALRSIFLVALIPSALAFLTISLLVREMRTSNHGGHTHFLVSMKGLPRNFRFFLIAVGVFGLGNFADSMLILRATEILSPFNGALVAGSLAILLYTIHNVFYAALSFPIGVLADKFGGKKILVFGYFLTGLSSAGFIFTIGNIYYLGLLFVVAGIAIAITDAMERTVAADLLPENLRGTGYGTLATVNGVGDFVSSTLVGLLWTAVSPAAGFGYGGALCMLGAALLLLMKGQGTIVAAK